jgi:hypothetical protein
MKSLDRGLTVGARHAVPLQLRQIPDEQLCVEFDDTLSMIRKKFSLGPLDPQ